MNIEKDISEGRRILNRRTAKQRAFVLLKMLGLTDVDDVIVKRLLKFEKIDDLKVFDVNAVVVLTTRYDYLDDGRLHMGALSQVHVFCCGERQMQEWRHRSVNGHMFDRHYLRVDELGSVKLSRYGQQTVVEVELLNDGSSARIAEFKFSMDKTPARPKVEQK